MNMLISYLHSSTAKRRALLSLLWFFAASPLASHALEKAPCWFSAEEINKQLGGKFSEGVVDPDMGLGVGCKYSDKKGMLASLSVQPHLIKASRPNK